MYPVATSGGSVVSPIPLYASTPEKMDVFWYQFPHSAIARQKVGLLLEHFASEPDSGIALQPSAIGASAAHRSVFTKPIPLSVVVARKREQSENRIGTHPYVER
jgi:hypothetical protein